MSEIRDRLESLSPEKRRLLELLERRRAASASSGSAATPDPSPRIVEDRYFNLEPGVFPDKGDVQFLYNRVTQQLGETELGAHSIFLNWGYVPNHRPSYSAVELPELYLNKNPTRLVLEVIADTPLAPEDSVLDVACGRGGTISVFRQHFKVGFAVGLDLSAAAVAFCTARHGDERTVFVHGDSEQLPFADGSMSVVTNLESSHCYPNIRSFYSEVWRVLRPGGHFCYTDVWPTQRVDELEGALADTGFVTRRRRDITSNVLLSCDDISSRHARLFEGNDQGIMGNFLAVPGSPLYNHMKNGAHVYLCFQLRKPATTASEDEDRPMTSTIR